MYFQQSVKWDFAEIDFAVLNFDTNVHVAGFTWIGLSLSEGLPRIEKNFYIEDPEVANMYPDEVARFRYVPAPCDLKAHLLSHSLVVFHQ